MVIEAYLRGPAFAVDYARNGLEAVAMEAQNHYDLILMDIEMPEMDGHEAARRICERRRNAGLSPVAILALTAHALEEEREATQLAGCSELLTKPIQRKTLLAAILRNLPQPQPDPAAVS